MYLKTLHPHRKNQSQQGKTMRQIIILIFSIVLFVSSVASAGAQTCTNVNSAGRLDCGFAATGWTATQLTFTRDNPYAVAVQADGKTVVAGIAYDYGVTGATGKDFGVTRYNADGSLDATFDGDGVLTTNSAGSHHDEARAVAIQADGKIVVAGAGAFDFFLARYNTDGSLDTTFGFNNGKVLTDFGNNGDAISDIAIQPDGKIIAVGTGSNQLGSWSIGAIARYNTDGSLDTTFDGDGKALLGAPGQTIHTGLNSVRLQADGKIVVLGTTTLRRFNANGSVDTSFGAGGLVNIANSSYALLIERDGKIVVGGFTEPQSPPYGYCPALTRYTSSGSVELSKINCKPNVWRTIFSMEQQSDGKIVAAGYYSSDTVSQKAAVYRFNYSLEPELSFNDGLGRFDITFRGISSATALAVQPDNKIVFSGWGVLGISDGESYFNTARLHSGTVAAHPPGEPFDFDGDGKADLAVFRPSTNTWHITQSSNAQTTEQGFGLNGDVVAPADFDGDGKTDLGVLRPASGDWWFKSSISGVFNTAHFGASGDIPRPSDFDGDGKADYIVFRPTDNVWYRLGTTGTVSITAFGLAGDKPLTGDFDADGKSDLAVYRPSSGEWWWMGSDGNILGLIRWGVSSDLPAPADYDGDNKTDFAVYRPSNGTWYIYNSSNNQATITNFGIAEDKPVAADYDGDGKADIAVFRPSTGVWYLLRSTAGFAAIQFGVSGDVPAPNAFVPN
jgi:uncharacterized delta-60 repeat protein